MQVLQGWVPSLKCVEGWYVSIIGLGPMSILDLSNWHVNIVNKTFTYLVLLLV
jgi:hypothetical protein